MEIKKIQKTIDTWIKTNTKGYWQPNNMMLRLVEEVGELAREINHKFGEKKPKSNEKNKEIGNEIADVLFTLVCISNSLDIDLEKYFNSIIKKLPKNTMHHVKKAINNFEKGINYTELDLKHITLNPTRK